MQTWDAVEVDASSEQCNQADLRRQALRQLQQLPASRDATQGECPSALLDPCRPALPVLIWRPRVQHCACGQTNSSGSCLFCMLHQLRCLTVITVGM